MVSMRKIITLLLVLMLTVFSVFFFLPVKAWSTPHELDGFIPSTVRIISPQNITYTDDVPLTFTVSGGGFEPNSPYSAYQLWGGGYSYSLDGKANVSITGNTTLTGLNTGAHWIVIYAHYYVACGQLVGPFSDSNVEPTYFRVTSTTPTLSIQEPQNKTYKSSDIALNFTIDRPTSSITYSLDNKANVTITGNTTLSGLSNGLHQIKIYADDTVASQPVYFSIEASEPFAMLPIIAIAGVSGGSVVVVGMGLIIYKRKKQRQNTTQ